MRILCDAILFVLFILLGRKTVKPFIGIMRHPEQPPENAIKANTLFSLTLGPMMILLLDLSGYLLMPYDFLIPSFFIGSFVVWVPSFVWIHLRHDYFRYQQLKQRLDNPSSFTFDRYNRMRLNRAHYDYFMSKPPHVFRDYYKSVNTGYVNPSTGLPLYGGGTDAAGNVIGQSRLQDATASPVPRVNPASGLPMMGGVDIAGNTFGTSFSSSVHHPASCVDHRSSLNHSMNDSLNSMSLHQNSWNNPFNP